MSKQSMGKKKGGADMPSDVSEDTSSSERAILELWNPTIAGVGKPYKEGGALVIPAKAMVEKNTIIDHRLSRLRRVALNKPTKGKRRAEPGTAKRGMAELDEKPKKTQKSTDNTEDHSELKHPPKCEMLVPVEPVLDPSVVIPPSTETEP